LKSKYLKKSNIKVTVLSPDGPDIKVDIPKRVRNIGYLRRFVFWVKTYIFIKKFINYYDIIWVHNPIFLKKISAKKIIVTIHGFLPEHYQSIKKYNKTYFNKISYFLASQVEIYSTKKLHNNGAFFTVVSPSTKLFLINLGISEDNIKIIMNGVNIKRFRPRINKVILKKELNLPLNKFLLLYVGRMSEQKNPYLLLDFYNKILHIKKDVSLVMVGKGPLLTDLKKYIIERNIPNIIFFGYVQDSVLNLIFSACDAFILASRYEGNPLVILEAISSGLPCIVQDIAPLKILINIIKTGISLPMEKGGSNIVFYKYITSNKFKNDQIKAPIIAKKYFNISTTSEKYVELFKNIYNKIENK